MMEAIFKGDDTRAFGNNFITVKINNKLGYQISKLEVITNSNTCIPPKPYTDPSYFVQEDIELTVNYTSEETTKLNNGANIVRVIAYDMNNYPHTLPQSLTFYAQNGVISRNGRTCC